MEYLAIYFKYRANLTCDEVFKAGGGKKIICSYSVLNFLGFDNLAILGKVVVYK